jgi:DNA-binding transcriptional MerR regulator
MTPSIEKPTAPYSAREVADLAGITYRQLDYWARTDLIRPSVVDAKGSGSRRRYSQMDLVVLRILRRLLDAGLSLEKIRRFFTEIQDSLKYDLAFLPHAVLMVSDQDILVANDESTILKYIREHSGVMWIFPIDHDDE